MTKWQVTKTFDVQSLADFKDAEQLQPLISYINEIADNISRLASGGVGVNDNLNATLKTLTMRHATPQAFSVKAKPIAVLVASQSRTTNPIASFVWTPTANGEVSVEVTYQSPTGPISEVTFVLLFS